MRLLQSATNAFGQTPVAGAGSGSHKRMPLFLLASLCLHAGLIFSGMYAFQIAGQQETVLSVSLTTDGRATEVAAAGSAGERTPPQNNAPSEAPQPPPTAVLAGPAPVQTAASIPAGDAGSEAELNREQQETARARIQAQLFADLQRYFEYPTLARRQGWQGTVWLSFNIEFDGTLRRIEVARSSGYDILDNSAVASLRRVGQLTQARDWLHGQTLEMDVPVVYKLKDH